MLPEENLQQVAQEVRDCTRCVLHHSRRRSVPGEGPVNAEIMLIGEGPGYYENEQGRPFVGASGKFLEELLGSIGLKREDVFICNVVKCRPPDNRDPLPEEILACKGYLDRQIEIIHPRVVVTLGRFSMAHFLPMARISSVHGQAFPVDGKLVVPMYHPAAALHQPALRTTIVRDFSHLPEFIAKMKQEDEKKNTPPPPVKNDPQQLSLF
ncbi:MAG: uracil-DNA glycosylase [Anaerolineaceae bacterium]